MLLILSQFFKPLQNKIIPQREEIGMLPGICLQNKNSASTKLPALFPVSLNTFSSCGGPDVNVSLSKFNQSFQLLPGDRPKRTTWPQIKGELRAPFT